MHTDLPAAALLVHGAGPGGLPGHLNHAVQVKCLQVQLTIPSQERALSQDVHRCSNSILSMRAGQAPACHECVLLACLCASGGLDLPDAEGCFRVQCS